MWAYMESERSRRSREKLLHAIVYFTKHTNDCHKTKLFKLLFFFDFEIYRETGRSVTGQQYFAWKMGPVPTALFDELKSPAEDLKSVVFMRETTQFDPDFTGKHLDLRPKVDFDPRRFTPRELSHMERLAEIYRDAKASEMSEISHLAGSPWHQVYEVERKPQAPIPYILAIDDRPGSITRDQAKLIDEEEQESAGLFK